MNLNLSDKETFKDLQEKITSLALPFLREFIVTHVHEKDHHRQLTIRLTFQDPLGTLQKNTVDEMEQTIRQAVGT